MGPSDPPHPAGGRQPTLYTIAPWRPFADDLAAGLMARYPGPLDLARVLVLLPSRRAGRALSDAFVRLSDGKALLLPRMAPAGDIDAEDALGSFAEGLEGAAEALPAIAALPRRLVLAKILANGRNLGAAEALALAGQLAGALDTLEIEGKRAADVAGAVPEGALQGHWARNAELLETLMRAWPDILDARGVMDAVARRNRLIGLLAARWAETPPPHPVVLAGFASAPPAVGGLARSIARLPQGMLVLPGLDTALEPEIWAHIGGSGNEGGSLETHPQHGMARLLAAAGLSPAEALPWPTVAPTPGSPPARATLVRRAMEPAALSGGRAPPPPPDALAGLRMVEAATAAEEALLIALALRQVAERPGRTAALITPDRALARRVTVQLTRFGIEIDDSAGQPLARTAPGSLLVALAVAAGERFAPVPLLAVLQHPLVKSGEGRLAWLNCVRALDKAALRGLRPPPGLQGVAKVLRKTPDLMDWWTADAAPLLAALEPLPADAADLVDALRRVAESLAGPALWAGDAGRALAGLFEALDAARPDLAALAVDADGAAALTTALLQGETVRPRWRRHPQLAIWGPLEARLQAADLIVMGGLNEGSWPAAAAPDPFLAPAIRAALGLPGLARRTGLQAHDFASALGAPEVLLTRAAREGSAPSVASRFWQRLAAAAGGQPDSGTLTPSAAALLATARRIDRPGLEIRFPQPAPRPPAGTRPRQLSVTDVAMLKADPFAFYAKHMLRLKPLDPRDAEPTGGERGQVVHKVLERWFREGHLDMEKDLDALIDAEMAKLGDRPDLAALWRPRVQRMARFAIEALAADDGWRVKGMESNGELAWNGVMLRGRADRVDSNGAGLRIVDYKTGRLPGVADVTDLWQTQLALLAAMAERGLLADIDAAPVVALDYVKLSGGREPGVVRPALGRKADAEPVPIHIEKALADFETLAGSYLLGDRPFTAKAHVVHGRRFADYDLLARVAEWLGR